MADRAENGRNVHSGNRRPTIHDVARVASVSPATVSNVLTGRRRVDPELAARVLATIKDLGYRRDVAASALRGAQRTIVGAIVPELRNPFFADLVDRLEREARASGRRLLVATSGDDCAEECRQIEALTAWRPAGVIAVPCDGSFPARAALERDGIPFVIVDRPLNDGGQADTVAVDNVAAAYEGARRLLEIGHRHLLVVVSLIDIGNIRERLAGIDAAIADVPGARADVIETSTDVTEVAQIVAAQLAVQPRPTAIFTLNNVLTLGTLRATERLGLEIPADVSLLGFDDYDWMEVFRPSLSAIHQPVEEMARVAWHRLAILTGAVPMGSDPAICHVRLPCTLAWRDSVAEPRASASAEHPLQEVLPP